jgi:hypothetical protein
MLTELQYRILKLLATMPTAITPKQIRTMLGLSNRELGGATRALYKRGWVNLHRSGARYEAEAEYKINDDGIRAMLDYEAHPPQPKTSDAKCAAAYREVLKEVRELLDTMRGVEWEEVSAECIRRIDVVLKD